MVNDLEKIVEHCTVLKMDSKVSENLKSKKMREVKQYGYRDVSELNGPFLLCYTERYTGYTKRRVNMSIVERKLRKIGNSVVVTLSKEFLESINAEVADTVYIDEEKLKEAVIKKEVLDYEEKQFEMMMAKSMKKHDELYKKLVDK